MRRYKDYFKVDLDLTKKLTDIVGRDCKGRFFNIAIDLYTMSKDKRDTYLLCTRDYGTSLYYDKAKDYSQLEEFKSLDYKYGNKFYLIEPCGYNLVTEITKEQALTYVKKIKTKD